MSLRRLFDAARNDDFRNELSVAVARHALAVLRDGASPARAKQLAVRALNANGKMLVVDNIAVAIAANVADHELMRPELLDPDKKDRAPGATPPQVVAAVAAVWDEVAGVALDPVVP